jgi:hypothetical protein
MKVLLPITLLSLALLLSCGEARVVRFQTGELALTAEGPLFEGSNTLTATYTPALEAFLKAQGASLADLQEARLVRASLSAADDSTLALINQVTLLMVADQAEMQELAVLNPLPQGVKAIELGIAQDQKTVADFLRQASCTFVADANLLRDLNANLTLTGTFEFDLTLQ